jgi:hypothetical protein
MKESSNLQANSLDGVGGEYAPEYAIEAAGWACSCTL